MFVVTPGPVSDVKVEPCRDPLRMWRVRFLDSAGHRFQMYCWDRPEAREAAKRLRREGIQMPAPDDGSQP